jgi:hypothetical protein
MVSLHRGIQIAAKKGLKVIAIDRYTVPQLSSDLVQAY